MIGMMLEDGESAVKLLQQDDAGEFVGEGHLSQRENEGSLAAGFIGEAVAATDCE